MKKQTVADIMKVVGTMIFMAGAMVSVEFLTPPVFTPLDLYALGLLWWLAAISIQTVDE